MAYVSCIKEVECDDTLIVGNIRMRTYLKLKFQRGTNQYKGKSITYIMMNPSKADKFNSDPTVDKLIELSTEVKKLSTWKYISDIVIINLIPLYETNSTSLEKVILDAKKKLTDKEYNSIFEKNLVSIEGIIKESDEIVLAWGNSPKNLSQLLYCSQAIKVIEIIKKFNKDSIYVAEARGLGESLILTEYRQPRHPVRIVIEKLHKCEIDSQNMIEIIE